MESIKNVMRYVQLGVAPNQMHNYGLRKWQRVLWFITLYIWRTFLFFTIIYLICKLIY